MPTNDPAQSNLDPRDERKRILARTLLRSFLATPAMPPQEAVPKFKLHMFQSFDGEMINLPHHGQWRPMSRAIRAKTLVVTLPESTEMVMNFPTLFSHNRASEAIKSLMREALGIDRDRYEAGHTRVRAGLLPPSRSALGTGHAIIIDEYAYRVMARQVCWTLADSEAGAAFLGMSNKKLYSDSMLPPLAQEKPAGERAQEHSEWSETREIARNMLRAAHCSEKDLEMLQERAKASENYGFMQMLKEHRWMKRDNRPGRERGSGGFGRAG